MLNEEKLQKLARSFENEGLSEAFKIDRIPKNLITYKAFLMGFVSCIAAYDKNKTAEMYLVVEKMVEMKEEEIKKKVEDSINNNLD